MRATPRQLHGRRLLAAVAAAGLLVSLFAPWYRESVVAHGLHGAPTLTLSRSGWQAFSFTETVVLCIAVLTLVIGLLTLGRVPADGGPGRLRRFGAVIAALGAIAFVVVLARLSSAPGTTTHALEHTLVALRWGIFLALGCGALLTAAGLRLIAAARPAAERSARTRGAGRARGGSARRGGARGGDLGAGAPDRAPMPARVAGRDAAPQRAATRSPSPAHPPSPRGDGRSPAPGARRAQRPRPARRADRPRWDDQAASWLDLPD